MRTGEPDAIVFGVTREYRRFAIPVMVFSNWAVTSILDVGTIHWVRRNWRKSFEYRVVCNRAKNKLSVEQPHLTEAQGISAVRRFPFQMERMDAI